jgi:hypothetical protein
MSKTYRHKKKYSKRTFYSRKGRKNRHHIKAKSLGGTYSPKNLILLDENRHAAFHLLFNNMDFKDAAALLLRADRMKSGIDETDYIMEGYCGT